MPQVLEIKNLTKRFERFALEDVTLTLEEGFIMGLVGPNGAGKTSLIKLILGLLQKDSGTIRVLGMDPAGKERQIKQKIGFVFDEPGWPETLRIRETAGFVSPFYDEWNSKVFDEYLARFGLDKEMRIETLSKGMKMKFSLAVALSHNARLIIMDEPTSGLDPIVRSELLEILQQLIAEENKSVLFSSHISTDVEKIADYITFINGGKVIFSESSEEISDRYRIVRGPAELIDGDTASVFDALIRRGKTFSAICTRTDVFERTFGELAAGGTVISERAGVDDIMLHMVKGEQHAQPCL